MKPRVLACLCLFLLLIVPSGHASADVSLTVRSGDSFVRIGDQGIDARVHLGKKRHRRHSRRHRKHDHRDQRTTFGTPGQAHSRIGLLKYQARRKRHPYEHHHHRRDRVFLLPARPRTNLRPEEDQVRNDPPAKPTQLRPAPPPEPVILDPSGSSRIIVARGAPLKPVIDAGEFLPAREPHVVLDPMRHGLAHPPPGQIYVRFQGTAYRIVATTRQVVERLP